MLRANVREAGEPRSLHLPGQSMVDSKPVPNTIVVALNMLMANFVEPCSPLEVWVLEGCGAALGGLARDDFGVVILEDAQQANQRRITPRFPRKAQTWNCMLGIFQICSGRDYVHGLDPEGPDMLAPRDQREQVT